MPEFTPKAVRVPGCIPRELAQPIEALAQLANKMAAGDTINIDVTTVGGDTITEIHNAANLTGELPAVVLESFVRVGLLAGPLTRDGEVNLTVDGGAMDVTVDGFLVPTGKQAPSGSRCIAVRLGGTWYAVAIDQCTEASS